MPAAKCERCNKRHVVKAKAGGLRCQGHTRAGPQCGKQALAGREYCKLHGGAVPRGVDSSAFKHGRYSKLPTGLLELFEAADTDDNYLSARADMSLSSAHLTELTMRLVPEADHPQRVEHIAMQLVRIIDVAEGEPAEVRGVDPLGKLALVSTVAKEAMAELDPILKTRRVWLEIQDWQEHRRKLMDSERKRIEAGQTQITLQQAQVMLRLVLTMARERMSASDAAQFIADLGKLQLLTGAPRDSPAS